MEITQIRVFPVDEEKLKAFVSIVFDDCFVISDIKIIQGNSGLFVSMPSKKRKNGTFRDIAHPLNNETRRRFEEQIVGEYRAVVGDSGGDATMSVRELEAEQDGADGGDDATGHDTFNRRDYPDPSFDRPGN
jgi:stage V sporulation protein G